MADGARPELERRLDARIASVRAALRALPAWDTDPMALVFAASAEFHRERQAQAPEARPTSTAFLARAENLLAAMEIALSVRATAGPRPTWASMISHAAELTAMGAVRTVAQLADLEHDFLTYWNEAPAAETRDFWDEVARRNLPYRRRDLLAEILRRGRITNRAHYEHAKDEIVAAHQLGRITDAEADRLGAMIDAYEAREPRRRTGTS